MLALSKHPDQLEPCAADMHPARFISSLEPKDRASGIKGRTLDNAPNTQANTQPIHTQYTRHTPAVHEGIHKTFLKRLFQVPV